MCNMCQKAVMLNLFQNPAVNKLKKSAWMLKQVQHDCSYAGFTLIELLVVVLIIGILSAVALPQYQKAVAKSRFTQLITAAKSLADAQTVYYMANGEYATRLDELDVSFPPNSASNPRAVSWSTGYCSLNGNGEPSRILCYSDSASWSVWAGSGRRLCCAYSSDSFAAASLCASTLGKGPDDWYNGCGSGGGCQCWSN